MRMFGLFGNRQQDSSAASGAHQGRAGVSPARDRARSSLLRQLNCHCDSFRPMDFFNGDRQRILLAQQLRLFGVSPSRPLPVR
jgi:hypothetical protein